MKFSFFDRCWFLFFIIILAVNFPENTGIRMYRVTVPDPLILGSAADLYCDYDMEGAQLYSVKWYKNGKEFFRFMPDEQDPITTLDVHGVYVDKHHSSANKVHLKVVRWSTEGSYRCEVTAGKPSYDTVVNTSIARIVAAPRHGPIITGQKSRYPSGGLVELNCTANSSKPATELSWYINSVQADNSSIIFYPVEVGRDGRLTTTLGLTFRLREHHFRNRPEVKAKCTAMLNPVYLKSNEISFEVKRPQKAPALESREKNGKKLEVSPGVYGGLVEIVDDEGYPAVRENENEPTRFTFRYNAAYPIISSHLSLTLTMVSFAYSFI